MEILNALSFPNLVQEDLAVEEKFNALFQAYKKENFQRASLLKKCRLLLDRKIEKDEQEFLDDPTVPIKTRLSLVTSLSRLNDISGYTAVFLKELGTLVKGLSAEQKNKPLRILDIGAGGGGLLQAIHGWGIKQQINLELSGIDLSTEFVEATQFRLVDQKIPAKVFQGDACKLHKIEDDRYDIVVSNYMLHHLRSPYKVSQFLSEVQRIAKRGWMIVDFDRRIYGPAFVGLSASFFLTPKILIQDGIKSVRRAYRAEEIRFILGEMRKTAQETFLPMTVKSYPLFPYWIIRDKKIKL